MQKAKAQSAMRPPFLARAFIFVTAVILLALLLPPRASHAQGIVRGAQQGAYEGSRVAGPVGGLVGGAVGAGVGGAVGVVQGVFGTPYYNRSRHSWGPNQSSTPRQPGSVARREQRVPTGESQPGSTPPAQQDQAAVQAEVPARPAVTASTAPQDQAAAQAEAPARPAVTASTAPQDQAAAQAEAPARPAVTASTAPQDQAAAQAAAPARPATTASTAPPVQPLE